MSTTKNNRDDPAQIAQTLSGISGVRLDGDTVSDAQDANGLSLDQEDVALHPNAAAQNASTQDQDTTTQDAAAEESENDADPDDIQSTMKDPFVTMDVLSAVQFFARSWVHVDAGHEEQHEDLPSRDEFMDPNNPNPGLLILSDPRANARPCEESLCPICREDMEHLDGLVVIVLCGHIFHRDCLNTWLQNPASTCPICRTVLFTVPSAEHDDDGEIVVYPAPFFRARYGELVARIRDLRTRTQALNEARRRLEDRAAGLSENASHLAEERERLMADYLAIARLSAGGAPPNDEHSEGVMLVRVGEYNARHRHLTEDMIRLRSKLESANMDTSALTSALEKYAAVIEDLPPDEHLFDESDRMFIDRLNRFIDEAHHQAEVAQAEPL
ncbi:uncharacterized protein N0V89_006626 [Didymosphaeria variabile]|uniref:RING-type domain-containing protein n=1 Tax=Didymosphaeria variabile TaxID=1932322 RepID=A0A9W8XI63_9PLEO|nr:uncharacterized protein N0V89_006626 [Didymosphaeria variabile]KAJ4351287.1 hypothetical protein N0V89_006626 [Didymosphaeria variabile]